MSGGGIIGRNPALTNAMMASAASVLEPINIDMDEESNGVVSQLLPPLFTSTTPSCPHDGIDNDNDHNNNNKDSKRIKSHTHITIDLAQKRVEKALSILRQRKRRKRVASALIHTKSARYGRISYDRKTTNQQLFINVFEALTDFPKLKQLAVEFEELETFITLPIGCLLLVLTQPNTRLKVISFSNVRFAGDASDMMALADALRCHPTLTSLTLHHCAGEAASLDPLLHALSEMPTMKHVELAGTRIRANDPYAADSLTWDGSSLVKLCQAPSQVKSLVLRDVPDIGNRHVVKIAQGLSFAKSKLKSLTLSSIRLGDSSGVALMGMLEVNRQLNQLTLDFDFGLVTCGQAIADALATNVHLQRLSLNLSSSNMNSAAAPGGGRDRRGGNATTSSHSSVVSWSSASSFGDDTDDEDDEDDMDDSERQRQRDIEAIDANVALMARALRDNVTLRHLKLCLDLDDYTNFQSLLLDESMAEDGMQDIQSNTRRSLMVDDSSDFNYIWPVPGENVPDNMRRSRANSAESEDEELDNNNNIVMNGEDAYCKITQAFEELLQHYNHTLYSLDLNDGMYEWKNFQARIEFYLKLNRAGIRPLLQQENATKEQWVQAIERQKDDINVLYYLLSRNPSLCFPDNAFGHVRDPIIRQDTLQSLLEDPASPEGKKEAKKLSWWKRGKHNRKKLFKSKKLFKRLAPKFSASFAKGDF